MSVLEVSAKAAKAGLTTTGIAADALTTLINAFGAEAESAEYFADLLFTTVKLGKTTMSELAPAIGGVATIAAQAGLSMEEVSGALAIMTRRGISTDRAVTFLRATMVSMLKPTEEAAEVAENLARLDQLSDELDRRQKALAEALDMDESALDSVIIELEELQELAELREREQDVAELAELALTDVADLVEALDSIAVLEREKSQLRGQLANLQRKCGNDYPPCWVVDEEIGRPDYIYDITIHEAVQILDMN